MNIDIDTIGELGLTLDKPLTAEWIGSVLSPDAAYAAAGNGSMQLQIHRSDSTIIVRGRVHMPIMAACGRCLGPAIYSENTPIELTLIPAQEMEDTGVDGELTHEQVSLGTYNPPIVDLAAIVHDEALLALPMQLLCQPDCQGLCNICGNNRNIQACDCQNTANLGPLGDLRLIRLKGNTPNKEDSDGSS